MTTTRMSKWGRVGAGLLLSGLALTIGLAGSASLAGDCAGAGCVQRRSSGPQPSSQSHETCRPKGLKAGIGTASPYCSVYDSSGRENLGAGRNRRLIGYFAGWHTGAWGLPPYLVSDIPWDRVTHINYAFAHIDDQNRLSVGEGSSSTNPATGMQWAGVVGAEMDPALPYKGHFNLLTQYKKRYPHVKTLISVGGWTETGGYFDDSGHRVASGGFFAMTKTRAGVNTFADSAVEFIRRFGFDGVDLDYEYPSASPQTGHPADAWISEELRHSLWSQYVVLVKILREKLDRAGQQDGRHYLLTAAVPASATILRGMDNFSVAAYFDFVSIMAYDLHGSWNGYVGHHAALYDTGADAELISENRYVTQGGIGHLNADWAYHYFRGALPPGRINLGVPLYTRGWHRVHGGRYGLWGVSVPSDAPECKGAAEPTKPHCQFGAYGIDDLWRPAETNGYEPNAGSSPLWHAKNLEKGIMPSYVGAYPLVGAPNELVRLVGDYVYHFDEVAKAPWLWNGEKKVFLSIEDEQSIAAKIHYIDSKGIGGMMLWELAGDYSYRPERREGRGEYFMGSTLVGLIDDAFRKMSPYEVSPAVGNPPSSTVDLRVDVANRPVTDNTSPQAFTLRIANKTAEAVPPGAVLEFDLSATSRHGGTDGVARMYSLRPEQLPPNNVGGLQWELQRVMWPMTGTTALAPDSTVELSIGHTLPLAGPANFSITMGGKRYALQSERME